MWARSFEQFFVEFIADGGVTYAVLKSRRNQQYVTTFRDKQSLAADALSITQAAKWNLFVDPTERCDKKAKESECWGPVPQYKASTKAANVQSSARNQVDSIPLFGSPKPLSALSPKDASDPYDQFIIAKRTYQNWQRLEGMQPRVYTDDNNTVALIQSLNRDVSSDNRSVVAIDIDASFEVHKKFKQRRTAASF